MTMYHPECRGFWDRLFGTLVCTIYLWVEGIDYFQAWETQSVLRKNYIQGQNILFQTDKYTPETSSRIRMLIGNSQLIAAQNLLSGKLEEKLRKSKQRKEKENEELIEIRDQAKSFHCVGPVDRAIKGGDLASAKKIIAKYSELLRLAQGLNIKSTIIPLSKNENTEAASKLIQRTQETNAHRKIKYEWTARIKSLSGEHQNGLFSLLDEVGKHQTGSRQFRIALHPLQTSFQKIQSSRGKKR